MESKRCAACGTGLKADAERGIPQPIRWLAAAGMAFFHGGMWALEWSNEAFCARCRSFVVLGVIAGTAMECAAVAFLIRLWLRRG